ncbi:recombinase family protein [Belnapia rosea]|uniref:recombinase family protein n=1 Tax=Belnapia rosea TaxID=938405 RepID=UPI00087FD139|nr:recombinase family protein [Belnapia rosea]SDB55854.1 Resolvase, N terminal domain [Belnapia rosea]
MIEADGYGRHSDKGQDLGDSQRRQRTNIDKACAEKGVRLNTFHYDKGHSARDGANLLPGTYLWNYEEAARRGEKRGRWFVVEAQDRIARSDPDRATAFITNLTSSGVTILYANTGEIVSPGSGLREMIKPMIEAESANKSNEERIGRVIDNIQRRRTLEADSIYIARVPDWLTCPKKTRKGEVRSLDLIQPKPGAKALIEEICTWRAAGDGSVVIADRLNGLAVNNKGYRPWRGERWSGEVIKRLCGNPAIIGTYIPHTTKKQPGTKTLIRTPGEPKPDYYPRMIGDDLWQRVQAARRADVQVPSGRPSRSLVNLFQGLCVCDDCGSSMYLSGHNVRGRQDRLICSQKKKSGARACTNRTHYSVQRLEAAFLDQGLTAFSKASDFAAARADADALAAALTEAEAAVREAQDALKNVRALMLMAKTDRDRAVVMATLSDANEALERAENDRDVASLKLDQLRGNDPDRLYREAEELVATCLAGNMDARRRMAGLLRTLIARVRFGQEIASVVSARYARVEFGVYLGRDKTVPPKLFIDRPPVAMAAE